MKSMLVLLCGVLVVHCCGCEFLSGGEELMMAHERAEMLRAQAAGLRKDAGDYALLIEKSEAELKPHQIRQEALLERRAALDERIAQLKARQEKLPPAEAKELDTTLARYADEREALSSKVDDETIKIRHIQQHVEKQRQILDACLYHAEESEQEALRIEQYSQEHAQQK